MGPGGCWSVWASEKRRADGSSAPLWRESPDGRRASRASRALPFLLSTYVTRETKDIGKWLDTDSRRVPMVCLTGQAALCRAPCGAAGLRCRRPSAQTNSASSKTNVTTVTFRPSKEEPETYLQKKSLNKKNTTETNQMCNFEIESVNSSCFPVSGTDRVYLSGHWGGTTCPRGSAPKIWWIKLLNVRFFSWF